LRGHIRQRGNKWCIVIDLGKGPDGKRKQKWFSGYDSQGDAEADLPHKLIDVQDGLYINDSSVSLKEYLNTWLTTIEPDIRPKTYQFYKYNVDHGIVPVIGHIRLDKLKPLDIKRMINKYLKDGTLSNTTIRHYYRTLSIALNKAVEWEIISKNPCKKIKPPAPDTPEMKVLTAKQVDKLLEYTKQSEFKVMYIPILLSVGCGLRRGEVLGLRWKDIDFENKIMHIRHNLQYINKEFILQEPKTKNGKRDIPLPTPIISILQEHKGEQETIKERLKIKDYKKEDAFVCAWENGTNIIPDYCYKTLGKLLKRCKLPHIRFHDLRHTYATLMLDNDANIKVLSELLGHSKTSITMDIYAHALPDSKKEAVQKIENVLFLKAE
jgi:integrase